MSILVYLYDAYKISIYICILKYQYIFIYYIGRGIYGVELFLLPNNDVILNEIAPRPHNSGHYTIEAAECDQFEQHLRAIMGLPLGGTGLKVYYISFFC